MFSLIYVVGAQLSLYNMISSFGVPFYKIYVRFSLGFVYDVRIVMSFIMFGEVLLTLSLYITLTIHLLCFSGCRWFNLACNIYRNAKWILFCYSKEENNRHLQRPRCFCWRTKFARDDYLISHANEKNHLLILFIQTSLPSIQF